MNVGAAEALIEILRNNLKLLSMITNQQIEFFVDLLKRNKDARYVRFLSGLCCCKDEAISKNQDFIVEKLVDHKTIKNTMLLPFVSMVVRTRGIMDCRLRII
jgi:hypothetical protein